MCGHDTLELCLVPMPAELSYTNEFRWTIKGIDACIAPIVNALNAAGIYTANSCCGHGKGDGIIILHDERALIIKRMGEIETMDNDTLADELKVLLNKHSVENRSDTPDFILANYLIRCLEAWEHTTQERERWYGRQVGIVPKSPENS